MFKRWRKIKLMEQINVLDYVIAQISVDKTASYLGKLVSKANLAELTAKRVNLKLRSDLIG